MDALSVMGLPSGRTLVLHAEEDETQGNPKFSAGMRKIPGPRRLLRRPAVPGGGDDSLPLPRGVTFVRPKPRKPSTCEPIPRNIRCITPYLTKLGSRPVADGIPSPEPGTTPRLALWV